MQISAVLGKATGTTVMTVGKFTMSSGPKTVTVAYLFG